MESPSGQASNPFHSRLFPRIGTFKWLWPMDYNRPFPSSLEPQYQSEYFYENDFDLNETETAGRTHFDMKGFALRLVWRHKRTRIWPITKVWHMSSRSCEQGFYVDRSVLFLYTHSQIHITNDQHHMQFSRPASGYIQ